MALQALQLPESVQSALDSIDLHLSNITKSISESFPEDSKTEEWSKARRDLLAWSSELSRRRKAFESKAFFIVTFGMLKAGKSTIVNTFAGKRVSPVGRSKETTLRSSIILAADEDNPEGIYLYSPFEGAKTEEAIKDETLEQKKAREERNANTIKEWRVESCRKLVERLNGLDYDTGSLEEKRESYSLERLEYILTKSADELPDFPNILPPVIRINTDVRINTDDLPVGLSSTRPLTRVDAQSCFLRIRPSCTGWASTAFPEAGSDSWIQLREATSLLQSMSTPIVSDMGARPHSSSSAL